jgi:hypothetical protein
MVWLDVWRMALVAVLICMAVFLFRRALRARHPRPYPTTHPAMHVSYGVALLVVASYQIEMFGKPPHWQLLAATGVVLLSLYGWIRSGIRVDLRAPHKR